MRILQLRYFATIAQLENVSQAAKHLHVSQSSLSKSLALLEEEMGASLFTRNGRKLTLNAAGARMQEFALMVLQELDYAKDDIRLLSTGAKARIRIGTAGGTDRLSECVAAFRKEHPVALYGDYVEHLKKDKEFYVYERNYLSRKLLVICFFSQKSRRFDAPVGIRLEKGTQVFGNYERNEIVENGFTARPYELRVYLFEPELPKDHYEGLRKA